MRRFAPLCLLLLVGPVVRAGSVEIDVNDDTARAVVAWEVRFERLGVDTGWLHHQDNGDVGHFGLHVAGNVGSGAHPVRAGVGARAFYVDAASQDGVALGIGGFVRYPLSASRVELGAELYLAPGSLASGDLDRYIEAAALVGFRILDRAEIHVGFRLAEVDLAGGSEVTIEEGAYVGIRLEF